MRSKLAYIMPAAMIFAGIIYAAVQTDYDHHANFTNYRTYSWIGDSAGNSLWQQRIMSAVDSEMAAKGLTKVASGGDLGVSAFGRTSERDTLETFYDGFPGWGWRASWWGGGGGMATTEVVPQRVGNLTVDLFDGRAKQLVWRGVACEAIGGKPESNEKKMDHAVDDMFKHYPPKEKGLRKSWAGVLGPAHSLFLQEVRSLMVAALFGRSVSEPPEPSLASRSAVRRY